MDNTKETGKVTILGITLPPETYAVLKSQISPKSLNEVTFKECIDSLVKVLAPKNVVITERFKLGHCRQPTTESVTEYIVAIKLIATTCKYEDFLDEALRDRLVSGMLSEQMVRRLLAESEELKFAEAVKVVMDMDAVAKSAALMSGEKSGEVNVIAEPACFRQLAIEDVQYAGASRGRSQHPPQWGGFTRQPYRETDSQNGALTLKKQDPQNACSCGIHHQSGSCPAWRWICYNYGRLRHIAKACHNSKVNDSSVLSLVCAYVLGVPVEPASVGTKVNCVEILFVVNTGIRISTKKKLGANAITPFPGELRAANRTGLQVNGVVPLSVTDEVSGSLHKLSLLVARDLSAPVLLGRDWLSSLRPGWQDHLLANSQVFSVHVVGASGVANRAEVLVDLKSKYTEAFYVVNNDRPISGFKVNINLKGSAIPVFHRAYDVPYALVQNLKEEFLALWASPIIVVPNKSGQIRLCMDLKATGNPHLGVYQYPLRRAGGIFNKFVRHQMFCPLDLTQAYLQLEVVTCRELLTINTINWLYRFNRLVFGLSSAPAIF
ncbi:hypothetical protein PR048_012210 [Dryococelus australis]|uniref:Reverse transcriptase domain-containing protein n=1 Tax=Dryococelus australis TaxID=614101 RepID=A0ABQ9HNP8_9NEOP|nr:hypothetical protein PR048_012210 [Dryococelus australis]